MTPFGRLPEVSVTGHRPFAVGSVLWRDARGALMCTIVAKATYDLVAGEAAPADVPLPIQEDDAHWDDDPSRSVHLPSDLAPFKTAAEVVIVGSAFAPGDRPARSVVARVVVGSVDKAVECFPPRRFRLDGSIDDASPLARFSLRWEHAAGGPGSENPAGIDVTRGDVRGRRPIPPLLPPAFELGAPGDHIPAVGVGPIPASWPARMEGLGPHERAWLRRPAASPMPVTLPSRAFQASPPDQWVDRALVANDRIVLENLHADVPRLVMSLSGVEPLAITAGATAMVRLSGDLLFIDTDRALCTLTFRGQVPISEHAARLHVVVVGTPMMASLSQSDVQQILERSGATHAEPDDPIVYAPADAVVRTTALPLWAASGPALPFAHARPGAAASLRPSFPDAALPFRGGPTDTQPAPLSHVESSSVVGFPTIEAPITTDVPPASLVAMVPAIVAPAIVAPAIVAPAIVAQPPEPFVPPTIVGPKAPMSVGQQVAASAAAASAPALVSIGQPLGKPTPARPAEPVRVEPAAKEQPAAKASGFDAAFGKKGDKGASGFDAASGKKSGKGDKSDKPSTKSSGFDAAFGHKKGDKAAKRGSAGAAGGGLKAASDAAADQERAKEPAPKVAAAPEIAAPRRLTVVDLLHHDEKIAPRLRGMKRFAPVFAHAGAKLRPVQSVDAPRVDASPEERARNDVLRVLSYVRPADIDAIRAALPSALDEHHDLELPLVLLAGELRPTFDEIEALRTTIAVAQPVAGGDKKLLAAVAVAQEALNAPVQPRADTTMSMAKQIEQASLSLSLPSGYVASEVERLLLEARKYKRRPLLGTPRIRADLALASGDVLTLYLPDAVADALPLLLTCPVVALCEPRPREDGSEPRDEGFFVAAIGRVLKTRAETAGDD